MADDDLIRPHDPFSGHETPASAGDTPESEKPAEAPAPEQEPAKKPPVRRARRARRTPPPAKKVQRRGKVAGE